MIIKILSYAMIVIALFLIGLFLFNVTAEFLKYTLMEHTIRKDFKKMSKKLAKDYYQMQMKAFDEMYSNALDSAKSGLEQEDK